MRAFARAGARLVNRDLMWHYTEGLGERPDPGHPPCPPLPRRPPRPRSRPPPHPATRRPPR
ncbi:3-ketosteroid-delta-1-dehydrogenase [Streptomyces venezuelae]|nr:3-ketosteroid-delta-1-dehydrogenase [Streptomyces venezuelae]